MTKASPPAPPSAPELPPAPSQPGSAPADDDAAIIAPFIVMSHAALFEPRPENRCDACGQPLPADDEDDGYRLCGTGAYLSVRGDDVRVEKAPLCPSCASAIGMTALARWEIEEEEG